MIRTLFTSRKSLPVLAALVLLTVIAGPAVPGDAPQSWKAPARAARKRNPIVADASSISAGKEIYVNNCLACHGSSGRGDGPKSRTLHHKPRNLSDAAVQSQSDGALFWKINEGRPPMPSFDEMLADEDRWNVINYIRTLPRK